MLFVIVMEGLSWLMDKATQGGLLSGFSVGTIGNQPLLVSHLFFTDDTLIFCDVDLEHITKLRYAFTWFEAISGLKVNLSSGRGVPNLGGLVKILGCQQGSLPMYLGLP
jgi:hypothetical protein